MTWLTHAPPLLDLTLLLLRWTVGMMFTLSGFYKLTDASRGASMRQSLEQAGLPKALAAPVATVELIAGLALVVGLLGALSAAALLLISLGAFVTTTLPKAEGKGIHRLENLLYAPEALLSAALLVLLATGAGAWSLDRVLLS